jgi:hypothetical protein
MTAKMSKAEEERLIAEFEKQLEVARAAAKPALLDLAAAYNEAVAAGNDATRLRRMVREDAVWQVNVDLVDKSDPEVAKALRDLGLHVRSGES